MKMNNYDMRTCRMTCMHDYAHAWRMISMNMHMLNEYAWCILKWLCATLYKNIYTCGTCTFECKCMYACKVKVSAWEACIV